MPNQVEGKSNLFIFLQKNVILFQVISKIANLLIAGKFNIQFSVKYKCWENWYKEEISIKLGLKSTLGK